MQQVVQSDNDLVKFYMNGDESALAVLLEKHQRKIFSYILVRVKDRYLAEDIFQDTFFKVIDSLREGNYREEGKFLPWVIMIAHNLCMDHFRRMKRAPNIVDADGKDIFNFMKFADESHEDNIVKQQTSKQIKDLINQLPEEQKEVLVLRHYAELSFKEIADMTNTNINTALGRMRYALLNLRKMIGEKAIYSVAIIPLLLSA